MSKYKKLLDLKDWADAKPILETVKGLADSAYTLAQTAYQIKETQPTVARNFLKTVIKEMDDACKMDDKNVEETDDNTENQSSSTTGLEKIGDSTEADEGAEMATDTKDQMGVSIGEMAPPMGMTPQQQVPPAVPQQQMQYTIQEASAIRGQFKKITEALKALDKKITETQNSQVRSIDVGTQFKGKNIKGSFIQETTGNKEEDLTKARMSISKMNAAMNKGTY